MQLRLVQSALHAGALDEASAGAHPLEDIATKYLFAGITIIGSGIGAFTIAESAPQKTSLATMALAFAVIPYCFTRAIATLTDDSSDQLSRPQSSKRVAVQLAATLKVF